MICPACREEMIVVEYKKIELDICMQCSGIWFDADELGLLLGELHLQTNQLGHPPANKPSEAVRKCPYCRKRMKKIMVGPGDGVMIDRCAKGHGLWFDGGELDVIVNTLQAGDEAGSPHAGKVHQVGSFLKDVLLAGKESA